ncbi:YjcQ family protein [Bacillus infantis]|uniref:YjcQ family protein n=1 Tax=Bacillus infantis TaxID=324767 RepID=UPI002FBD4BB8
MDRKKIMYSILKEIEKGEQEPKASDFEIEDKKFYEICKILKDGEYLNNVALGAAYLVWLNSATLTEKGYDFLDENSPLSRTYKGLKEVRDWLK